jgi:amino acid transporter
METLAQSVSTMAPTTTPAATIPLVCALAGNGTWLAYALATAAVLLVALCIARYARLSASPGSLYTYASMTLPPWLSATVAWSLLLAYVATGSSVIGGFYHYANLLAARCHGPRVFPRYCWPRWSPAFRSGLPTATSKSPRASCSGSKPHPSP